MERRVDVEAATEAQGETFPVPRSVDDIDIVCTSPASVSHQQLFELLTGAKVERVSEMSDTVCLLYLDQWVVKTRRASADEDRAVAQARARASAELTARVGVWHPTKLWFTLQADGCYWPCSITRRLKTLRSENEPQQSLSLGPIWRALALGVRVFFHHGLRVDPNPSNWALEEGKLYYVDDELYAPVRSGLLRWHEEVVS